MIRPVSERADVLILGCGYTGSAVAAQARGLRVVATVRSEERAIAVRAKLGADVEVVVAARLESALVAAYAGNKTSIVVCFATSHEAPDRDTDVQDEVRNVARTVAAAVLAIRAGVVLDPGAALPTPRPK